MYRKNLVLMFLATPLVAQQLPARAPLPDPAPVLMPAIAPVAAAAAARADAMAVHSMAAQAFSVNVNMEPVIARLDGAFGQGFGAGFGSGQFDSYSLHAPQGWAPQDPADSLYRQAQQAMSRGDYRRAASLFKDLPVKQPNSVYASDALYWQAFSLYRIGGTKRSPSWTSAKANIRSAACAAATPIRRSRHASPVCSLRAASATKTW